MKRRIILFGGTVVLYAVLMTVAWTVGTRQAERRTEAMLDYAVSDIRTTLDGVIDTLLEHLASIAVRHFKKPAEYAMEEVSAVAKAFDIDEVNVVDRTGRIIATNDPDCLGVDMKVKVETRPFVELTNGVTKVVSQPFRRHAYAVSRRKYLGVPFPNGNGYIQVGLDESRMFRMVSSQLAFLFDVQMGDTVRYLCADLATGALVSAQSDGGHALTLAEIGFDVSKVPGAGKTMPDEHGAEAGKTFEQTLSGRKSFCRSFVFGGHLFLMIEPKSEFYGTRNIIVATMAVLLVLVLGGLSFLIDRIFRDSDRLKAFYSAEDARRAKDMEIAKTIQNAALPGYSPESPSYRIAAEMQAARDVGGDFYDYFTLDATHVAFLVADVSGKGVTAALYMMTAKSLIKNTLMAERDPAAALTKVNSELCRNNPANMFLTAWVGVIDLETGVVTFANAGHNPPVLIPSGTFAVEKSGLVLAFMDGVEYKSCTLKLSPGDTLFLYTDGVTEALDARDGLFGEDRLVEALKAAPHTDPELMCKVVRMVVAAFANGARQADDITVLALRYIAPPRVFVRSFVPSAEGIAAASAFLDEVVEAEPADLSALHVIVDEICSNVVRHSGASGFEISVELTGEPEGVTLTFIDDGVAYNPLSHADPDTSLPAEKRPIGGLGILLVKNMSDSMSYRRVNDRNFLTVRRSACKKVKKS